VCACMRVCVCVCVKQQRARVILRTRRALDEEEGSSLVSHDETDDQNQLRHLHSLQQLHRQKEEEVDETRAQLSALRLHHTHTSDTREQLYKQRNGAAPDEEPFRTPFKDKEYWRKARSHRHSTPPWGAEEDNREQERKADTPAEMHTTRESERERERERERETPQQTQSSFSAEPKGNEAMYYGGEAPITPWSQMTTPWHTTQNIMPIPRMISERENERERESVLMSIGKAAGATLRRTLPLRTPLRGGQQCTRSFKIRIRVFVVRPFPIKTRKRWKMVEEASTPQEFSIRYVKS